MAVRIPAFCDNPTCGTIFPSGFSAENVKHLSIVGCTAGPCPVCGNTGHIPDGVYDVIQNTIQVICAPERTLDDIKRLRDFIAKAKLLQLSTGTVQEEILKKFPWLAVVLPSTTQEVYTFLNLLIAIIGLNTGAPNITQQMTVNNVVEKTYIEYNICPCGSGKEFIRCHGK